MYKCNIYLDYYKVDDKSNSAAKYCVGAIFSRMPHTVMSPVTSQNNLFSF